MTSNAKEASYTLLDRKPLPKNKWTLDARRTLQLPCCWTALLSEAEVCRKLINDLVKSSTFIRVYCRFERLPRTAYESLWNEKACVVTPLRRRRALLPLLGIPPRSLLENCVSPVGSRLQTKNCKMSSNVPKCWPTASKCWPTS